MPLFLRLFCSIPLIAAGGELPAIAADGTTAVSAVYFLNSSAFGLYKGDLTTPRKATKYLHNLTTILADNGLLTTAGKVDYSIRNPL
jgi:hypothetical protein